MILENPILMAKIGAPHGVRGEVRVKTYGDDPLALGDYGSLYSKDGRKFRIMNIRPAKTVVVVKFKGINSREESEALNGTELFIDRSKLPDDNEEDEFYITDLIGCKAVNTDAAEIGTVLAMPNFGAGDLVEIQLKGSSRTVLIEFSHTNVPDIDLANRTLTIVMPAEVSERDGIEE